MSRQVLDQSTVCEMASDGGLALEVPQGNELSVSKSP
jgi:hypothetical protein